MGFPPPFYRWKPHPWHGLEAGPDPPGLVHAWVVSERPIARAEVIVTARVVGGLPMPGHGEADDEIIAVLENDTFRGKVRDLQELPAALLERLRHYFETCKLPPGELLDVSVGPAYGRDHAEQVVAAAIQDYVSEAGGG